ncbi:aldehyde dehydrogenase ALDC [Mycobacterium tuberculosis]|nr:aldehyde dehydrogenase ALDC [Mycobacterium tuberculosis]
MSTTQLINPATEEVLASVDHTDANAVDDAVQRARAAQRRWARLAPAQRAAGLRAFAAAVQAHLDELAALEVANSGHPIVSAEWEAGHVRDVLAFYAASPERLSGRQIPVAGGVDVTFNEPMGVVGVITPWNFPMVIASWAIAPALAAGNAVLVKPAELTPLTTIGSVSWPSRRVWTKTCCRCCRERARWSGSGSSPTPTFARSCSPGPPKSASGSWPVPRLKSNE